MRTIGTMHPTDAADVPIPSDVQAKFALAAATAQAADWPSGVGIARVTGVTTLGGPLAFYFNDGSTKASSVADAAFTSGTSQSSGLSSYVVGSREFQIPGTSTGFSLAAASSGVVSVECWRK
jgi:hypothetical protein